MRRTALNVTPLFLQTKKPSWWIVLADDKSNRVVVPPLKISDIPYSQEDSDHDYRAYKIQFQGPPNTGLFTWKVYIVSDTFVGEEAIKDISVSHAYPSHGHIANHSLVSPYS